MVDQLYDRNYQAARAQLNSGIAHGLSDLMQTLGDSLKALHRIEWSAPWASKKTVGRA